MKTMKINLEKINEEMRQIGCKLFGTEYEIVVGTDLVYMECFEKKREYEMLELMLISTVDKNKEIIDFVRLERVHKQYDFLTDTLYGFYMATGTSDISKFETLSNIASTFNKTTII